MKIENCNALTNVKIAFSDATKRGEVRTEYQQKYYWSQEGISFLIDLKLKS